MVIPKEKRETIILLHQSGLTIKEIISKQLATPRTVYRIIKQFKETKSVAVKTSSGRRRLSSSRQDRSLIRHSLRDRTASSSELAQEWKRDGVEASTRTVRRRLFDNGLASRRAAKKPLLTPKNVKDRLAFCRKYEGWTTEQWGKVMFSDESPFPLFGPCGKSIVRRRTGERFNKDCVIPTVKHPATLHVWGCFSGKGTGALTILPKNTAMNAKWYVEVLNSHLLPTIADQFPNQEVIFQHDGAPCHNAKISKKFLDDNGVQILGPWPGNSADLNPIENLWSIVKNKVNKNKPTNLTQLGDLIEAEWKAIDQKIINSLVNSMPKRIKTVLKKRGGHCKY